MPAVPDKKTLVLHEQVTLLFRAIPNSILANVFGAVLALVIYVDAVSLPRLLTWIGLLQLVTVGRALHYRRFRRQAPGPAEIARWYTQFRVGAIMLAAVVGSAGFLLFVYDNENYQLTLALMMVCIAAFVTSSLAPRVELAVLFQVLILGPLIGTLYLSSSGSGMHAYWMMLLLLVMLIISSVRIGRTIERSIELTIEAGIRERDLRSSQQRLGSYVQQTPLAVLEWSATLVVTAWNPAAVRIFGYGADQAIGSNLASLVFAQSEAAVLTKVWEQLRTGQNGQQLIVENLGKDGQVMQCEWFNTLLHDKDGMPSAVMSLVQDVSERIASERLKQEFISIVSHELRTPVTSIKGSLGLLTSGVLDGDPPQQRELLDIALQNANRLQLLINDILDVDKLDSGKVRYDFKLTDLVPLIEAVIKANQPYAGQYGVTVSTAYQGQQAWANVDPDRLTQVLTNLLSNAIKFSAPQGRVVLSLVRQQDKFRVAVNNHGEVIPEEERTRLFTKFYQRDSSDTRKSSGTGLGLYICQRILQRHGSCLDFVSNATAGTTFFFDLDAEPDGAP